MNSRGETKRMRSAQMQIADCQRQKSNRYVSFCVPAAKAWRKAALMRNEKCSSSKGRGKVIVGRCCEGPRQRFRS